MECQCINVSFVRGDVSDMPIPDDILLNLDAPVSGISGRCIWMTLVQSLYLASDMHETHQIDSQKLCKLHTQTQAPDPCETP